MKRFSPEEIKILELHADPGTFTKEDLENLSKGVGAIKLEYTANKVIEKYRVWEQKPLSRKEALKNFTHLDTHNKALGQLLILKEALIRKGVLSQESLSKTEHELITEKQVDLCSKCIHSSPQTIAVRCSFGNYKLTAVFANEIFADLEAPLANKVVNCAVFEKLKQDEPALKI